MTVLGETADVPCGACTACCTGNAIFLYPEYGDVLSLYDTARAYDPIRGGMGVMIASTPNGRCRYLSQHGCGIWANRPAVCRGYDCADHYAKLTRPEKKRMKREGKWSGMWVEGERRFKLTVNGKEVAA